jgi:hypothetical protein
MPRQYRPAGASGHRSRVTFGVIALVEALGDLRISGTPAQAPSRRSDR